MAVALQHPVTYTQALAKGGALLDETRALLTVWQPGQSERELADSVLQTDILGRATAHRARDLVRVFASRFLRPNDQPAHHLRMVVEATASRRFFSDLVFYYTAAQDDLLRDFTTDGYWPAVREGRLTIDNIEVRRLILEGEVDGRIPSPWSAELKRDMAGRVMIALTEFGLLRELRPARREVLPYAATQETLLYLSYLLHSRGVPDGELPYQPDWALFGLEPRDVLNRLSVLQAAGWFVVQHGGSAVSITWKYRSVGEALDALLR